MLREELQKRRRKEILEQQQPERRGTRLRGVCTLCSEGFLGKGSVLVNQVTKDALSPLAARRRRRLQ